MASILSVEQIKGLSSGDTPNTVTLPAGQTLDASAGTFTPSSGQVIQMVREQSNSSSSGSGTWVSGVITASLTPKSSTSKVVAFLSLPNNYTSSNNDILVRVLVNDTDIAPGGNGTYGGIDTYINVVNSDSHRHDVSCSIAYSSGSTAAQTWSYKIMDTNASLYYVNYPGDTGLHSITLWEIAG